MTGRPRDFRSDCRRSTTRIFTLPFRFRCGGTQPLGIYTCLAAISTTSAGGGGNTATSTVSISPTPSPQALLPHPTQHLRAGRFLVRCAGRRYRGCYRDSRGEPHDPGGSALHYHRLPAGGDERGRLPAAAVDGERRLSTGHMGTRQWKLTAAGHDALDRRDTQWRPWLRGNIFHQGCGIRSGGYTGHGNLFRHDHGNRSRRTEVAGWTRGYDRFQLRSG